MKCHEGSGLPRAKCRTCHGALGERIDAGKGLHARPEYRECATCHIEHQGPGADLVWWGKGGRDTFDHRLTGHALEGKHAALACASCHQSKFVAGGAKLIAGGSSTYLGLSTTCASCHADEHRGQFKGKECTSCHGPAGWKPAPRFDHATTAYPLTGRHASVVCEKCHHAASRDDRGSFRGFRVAGRECTSCHEDVHKGRFGGACATCHDPGGWRPRNLSSFDHNRTSYPLKGRHTALACDRCHLPGRPLRLPFGKCTDCHADTHLGQFAKRPDQGRCESCHDANGFSPAKFALEDHQKTSYPLAGAHLAVPCDACHKSVGSDALVGIPGAAPTSTPRGRRVLQFRFTATRCADCHRDPHRGELAARAGQDGCASCHKVDSWGQITFDHGRDAGFALDGAHASLACAACHPRDNQGGLALAKYKPLPRTCKGCHGDSSAGREEARP